MVEVLAPAKINLTLHVTGQREDGYHLIDSLVAFAPVGDVLTISEANTLSLTVEGPEAAGVPADMSNLALKAAAIVAGDAGAALVLDKRLPVASGIGGGSSDAAAALRGMLFLLGDDEMARWSAGAGEDLRPAALDILSLGADVPMCLMPRVLRAQGIGEKLSFASLPPLWAVLANPRVPVSTPEVFRNLASRANPPMSDPLPKPASKGEYVAWLATQRNDLEPPAIALQPVIATVLDALRGTKDCQLARMSGSGATCFAIYPDAAAAEAAAAALSRAYPGWWVEPTWIGDCEDLAAPR